MEELREICGIVQEEAHEEAIIKWGLVYDEGLADEIRVTVIATGIGNGKRAEMERPVWTHSIQPAEDLEIPTILRTAEAPRNAEARPSNLRPAANLGVVGAKRNIVHPDLQYEESELDIPAFLRKDG